MCGITGLIGETKDSMKGIKAVFNLPVSSIKPRFTRLAMKRIGYSKFKQT